MFKIDIVNKNNLLNNLQIMNKKKNNPNGSLKTIFSPKGSPKRFKDINNSKQRKKNMTMFTSNWKN